MVEGFHWPSESLLRNGREGITVVDDYPSIDTLSRRNPANVVVQDLTKRMDSTVLMRRYFNTVFFFFGLANIGLLEVGFEELFCEGGFSSTREPDKENVGRVV